MSLHPCRRRGRVDPELDPFPLEGIARHATHQPVPPRFLGLKSSSIDFTRGQSLGDHARHGITKRWAATLGRDFLPLDHHQETVGGYIAVSPVPLDGPANRN